MPKKIQVAFQGGGAKLCALLAAAEALQKTEADGTYEVTRIAGTSAGAIVACLFAAGIDISHVRASLFKRAANANGGALTEDGRKMAAYYGKKISASSFILSLIRGKPIRSTDLLEAWLKQHLCPMSALSMSQLERKRNKVVFIPTTHLGSRALVLPDSNMDVVQAILDSCALPFFFRMWGGGTLDGGIVENLPIDRLVNEQQTFGPVIAFSFGKAPNPSAPAGIKDFILSITDSAISAAEDKARESLPVEQVYLLPPDYSTFDFSEAISFGLSHFYDGVRGSTTKFLMDFHQKAIEDEQTLKMNPWAEVNPTARYVMNKLGELYHEVELKRPIRYESVRFSVFANSLRKEGDPLRDFGDRVEFALKFHVGDSEVSSLAVALVLIDSSSRFQTETAKHNVFGPDGKERKTIAIPMSTVESPCDRDLCVFFDPPLQANSGPYKIMFYEFGFSLLQPLVDKGRDELAYLPRRAGGPISTVQLIVYVPEEYDLTMKPRGKAKSDRPLRADECHDTEIYPRMKAVGWEATEVDVQSPEADRWQVDLFAHVAASRRPA